MAGRNGATSELATAPGVSPDALGRALAEFGDLLGSKGLLTEDSDVGQFRDPFAFPGWRRFEPAAVLMPESVEEVQAILRIANAHKVPLWTSSQGRNNGYGGAAPRVSGSLVLSLRRMNRVLEVNEESGYALVEPGVRFFDLYDHLRAIGSSLWMSVPDLGWGSVLGNTHRPRHGLHAQWRPPRQPVRAGGGAAERRIACAPAWGR